MVLFGAVKYGMATLQIRKWYAGNRKKLSRQNQAIQCKAFYEWCANKGT